MHSLDEPTMALVKIIILTSLFSPPSSLQSKPLRASRQSDRRLTFCVTSTKAAETQKKNQSPKQSRNFASLLPDWSVHKSGPPRMASCTSEVISMFPDF
jgi:hypothetical protein